MPVQVIEEMKGDPGSDMVAFVDFLVRIPMLFQLIPNPGREPAGQVEDESPAQPESTTEATAGSVAE